jgi:hypothetical protein
MGRRYAGILGLLAFAMVLVHGVLNGGGAEATLLRACGSMAVMAVVGATIGGLAGWIVADSVRAQLIRQLSQSQQPEEARRSPPAN